MKFFVIITRENAKFNRVEEFDDLSIASMCFNAINNFIATYQLDGFKVQFKNEL